MKIKICLLFLLFEFSYQEVLVHKKNFDDLVKDFYNKLDQRNTKNRKLETETLTPYFLPFGETNKIFVPFDKTGQLKELNNFYYDKNKKKYQDLYQQYIQMFNTPITRLQNIQKYERMSEELNNNHFRFLENPESFQYDKYYDGFDEDQTLTAQQQFLKPPIFNSNKDKEERKLSLNSVSSLKRELRSVEKRLNKAQLKQQYLDQEKKYFNDNFPNLYKAQVPDYMHRNEFVV